MVLDVSRCLAWVRLLPRPGHGLATAQGRSARSTRPAPGPIRSCCPLRGRTARPTAWHFPRADGSLVSEHHGVTTSEGPAFHTPVELQALLRYTSDGEGDTM